MWIESLRKSLVPVARIMNEAHQQREKIDGSKTIRV
jgi:hypothetical protein